MGCVSACGRGSSNLYDDLGGPFQPRLVSDLDVRFQTEGEDDDAPQCWIFRE